MAEFNVDDYFANRSRSVNADKLSTAMDDKFVDLQRASADKVQQLTARIAATKAAEEANANSWVRKAGLNPNDFDGSALNLAAEAYSGTSRLAGQVAGLPHALLAGANQANLSEQDIQALNRHAQGKATSEDIAQINRKVAPTVAGDPNAQVRAQAIADLNPNAPTPLSLWIEMNKARAVSRNINEAFDRSNVVEQTARNALNAQAEAGYAANAPQIGKGADAIKTGDFTGGAADVLAGTGKLVGSGISALASNPRAVAGYVAENAPQLLVGAAGKAGAAAMATSNVGYAADIYNQGIENYQTKNGGALPPEAERQRMILQAESLALAEQGGDMAGLAIGKVGAKAVVGGRTSIAGAVGNSAKAVGEGFLTEAPTEALQTYLEGEITGKSATGAQIYTAGLIGGASGAGLSGGMRTGHETAVLASQPSATKVDTPVDPTVVEAAATGKVDHLVNPTKSTYAPDTAIQALFGHSQLETTSPEDKQANLAKADEILTDLQNEREATQLSLDATPESKQAKIDQYKSMLEKVPADNVSLTGKLQEAIKGAEEDLAQPGLTVAERNAATARVTQLDRLIKSSAEARDSLSSLVQPKAVVDSLVQEADQPGSKDAAEKVITLAMASPQRLTAAQATQLANNTNNALTAPQRTLLREFSAARIAENELMDLGGVSADIYTGAKNKGIAQYRANFGRALIQANKAAADMELAGLTKFEQDHVAKATIAGTALKSGMGTQIVSDGQGNWSVPAVPLKPAELKKNGGLAINSGRLVETIQKEANALTKVLAEMQTAYANKFNVAAPGKSNVKNVPQAGSPQPTQSVPKPRVEAPAVRTAPEAGSGSNTIDKGTVPNETGPSAGTVASAVEGAGVDLGTRKFNDLTDPKEKLNLYRGEGKTQIEDGAWWSFDRATAEHYAAGFGGRVLTKVMSVEDIGKQTAQGQGGPRHRVFVSKADVGVVAPVTQPTETTQEANASPVELKTTEGTETSTAKAESTEDTTPAKETGELSVMTAKSPEGTSFNARNLVADYFTQTASKEGYKTSRPLVIVKDFLKGVTFESVLEFLDIEKLSDAQEKALSAFETLAEKWSGVIQSNLFLVQNTEKKARAEEFKYQDMMQYLLQSTESGVQLDENVKTAISYAAFGLVAEYAAKSPLNNKEEINAILGRDETNPVTKKEMFHLTHVGTRQNLVINSLGQKVAQSLGLKAKKDAPLDLQARLESALGAHALKLLLDLGIAERSEVSGEIMAELTGKEDTKTTASFQFIKIAPDTKTAKQILDSVRGTQNVLDKLFGVEAGLKEPSLEPVKFTQTKTKNTRQEVPEVLAKVMAQENAVASYVRQDMWALLGQLSEETMLKIAGAEEIDGKHVMSIPGIEAKNDGLAREIARFKEYVGSMSDMESAMFFEHNVWKQQRVGISTNMINPQTSKVHRHMLYRQAWDTKIDVTDVEAMQDFFLRVGEGLGVKTDKQDNEQSMVKALDKIHSPEVKDAVDVLVQMLQGVGMTEAKQEVLATGVAKGGEKMHSLDALMALAQMHFKLANRETTFNTQLMGEVDGVVNGAMLSHLLFGASDSPEELSVLLNRGGFYEQGHEHTQYNQWRGAPGNFDLYEITTLHMTQSAQAIIKNGIDAVYNQTGKVVVPAMPPKTVEQVMAAIYDFTGELVDTNGTVQKAGRNIIKTPLTAMLFGSSVNKAIDSMANNFVESIFEAIEDSSAGKERSMSAADLVGQINLLLQHGRGTELPAHMSLADLMKWQPSKDQNDALKRVFSRTLGAAVKDTMQTDFAAFIEKRKQFNDAAELTFSLYNAVYKAARADKIAELVAAEKIAVNGVKAPIHDLTAQQEAELRKELESLAPIMHTMMSKENNNLNAGLYISKSSRKLSTEPTYQSTVKFGKAFKDNGAMSTGTNSFETVETAPGVAMLPMSAHSADSAAMHLSDLVKLQALNVHDAQGVGVGQGKDAARGLNQSLWNVLLNYSPAAEMSAALERTVQGIGELVQAGKLSPTAVTNLTKAIEDFAVKKEANPATVLQDMVDNTKALAYKADDVKLQVLGRLQAIDQYAFEEGNYEVSETDRAAATAKRSELTREVEGSTAEALKRITEALKEAPEVSHKEQAADIEKDEVPKANTNPYAKLGTPFVASDPTLVKFFQNTPNATAKQVISLLVQKFSDKTLPNQAFNLQLLKMLSKSVDPDLPVHYVTGQTQDLIPELAGPARAWFTARNNKEEIYVLSPEFEHSGLTAEALLHELTHAAVTSKVYSNDPAVKPYVDELYILLEKAQKFVKANKLSEWDYAVSTMDELIAYGMTNELFQQRVLAKLEMKTKNDGFKGFVRKLTGLLFGAWGEKQGVNDGLTALIGNVTGLMALASKSNGGPQQTRTMAMANIEAYSTMDIFNAIDNGTLDSSFQDHLRNLLGGIVEKIHGPFGSFKEAMRKSEAGNPLAVWLKALETGKAPFASSILASGFTGTSQQDFAMEQVEATVRAALNANEAFTREAYRDLAGLYTETQARLKASDFLGGDWKTNTMAEAQAMYDFVFKLDKSNGDRSDYLARFAALGLAHQGFNKLLQAPTGETAKAAPKSFAARVQKIFEGILDFFHNKYTHTYKGQPADQKLAVLVEQLVHIEAKKRHVLVKESNIPDQINDKVEEEGEKFVRVAHRTITKIMGNKAVRNHSSAFVRGAFSLARGITRSRIDGTLQAMIAFRDSQTKGIQGLAAGLITNVKTPQEAYLRLLLATKKNEKIRKDEITHIGKFALESFVNAGRDMTKQAKAAVTSVFLRTGAHVLLDHMDMNGIEELLGNKAVLDKTIASFEDKLTEFGNLKDLYIEDANGLGYWKATGINRVLFMKTNATQIAKRFGSPAPSLTDVQVASATATINALVTLYALKYTSVGTKLEAKNTLTKENARPDAEGNGVEYALLLAKNLEVESLARLFDGNPAQMVHGFTPEIYNYNTMLTTANEAEGIGLLHQGYSKGAQVPTDPADPDKEVKHMYRLSDGGMAPHLTGVIGYYGTQAKGSNVHSGYMNAHTATGANNQQTASAIQSSRNQAQQRARNIGLPANRDMSKEQGSYMAPIYNESGDITNWRYLMAESTKDTMLERTNDFDKILGTLAGTVIGKPSTIEQNREAVKVMLDQYTNEYATRGKDYIKIGPKSADAELRDMWYLLPNETKEDIREIWGSDEISVRSDALDILFGYRKLSAADMFKRANEERKNRADAGLPTGVMTLNSINLPQKAMVAGMEWVLRMYARGRSMSPDEVENYAKRAAKYAAMGEKGWQELVHETKDILIVKSGITLAGNILSNFSMLYLQGVPVADMVTSTLTAFRGATAYQHDNAELQKLRTDLEIGRTLGQDAQMKRRILVLEDAIARNPVSKLIDAGLMPTIVEDLAAEEDTYSYKSALTRKVDGLTSKMNPTAVRLARNMYMAHDTKMYQGLSHITQLSDFVARYALYQHQTTRKKNPLTEKEAILRASEAFVNYDIPMHRAMQYSDDMGFTMFTKYFLYIQREIWRAGREHPARLYSMMLLNNYMSLGPIVLESSMLSKFGNDPFRSGALGFPGSLDRLMTVKAALAIVK